jgi:hypothetical protein
MFYRIVRSWHSFTSCRWSLAAWFDFQWSWIHLPYVWYKLGLQTERFLKRNLNPCPMMVFGSFC